MDRCRQVAPVGVAGSLRDSCAVIARSSFRFDKSESQKGIRVEQRFTVKRLWKPDAGGAEHSRFGFEVKAAYAPPTNFYL